MSEDRTAQARQIARYWLGDGEQVMILADDGPWVTYDSHVAALISASAAKDEEIAKLRASLQKVAEHDGERGEFTDDDIFERKPSPQDIARAVLKGSNG